MSKKIAHLGTVILDTKLAASKQLNADEILANGEDVAEMFNREHTYREMVTRVKLEPEDNYILYTDDGTVVTANLSGVTNGTGLFTGAKIDKISQKNIDDWKMEEIQNATNLFARSSISEFEGTLPNVSISQNIFINCTKLAKAKIDFPKIKDLSSTFQDCTSLKSFEGNLDNITNGNNGFWNTGLESFDIPLPSMTTPHWMFCGANKLKSFSSYMPLVTNAQSMFGACTSLTSFTSKIKRDEDEFSSLSNGTDMFLSCKLDAASVENVLTQIQPFEDGSSHTLTLGISAEAVPALNEITGNTLPLSSANTDISYKGWTLKVAVNDLPSNYRVVDYLESTGTQWIDTDIIFNSDTEIKCCFMTTKRSEAQKGIYGRWDSTIANGGFRAIISSTTELRFYNMVSSSPNIINNNFEKYNVIHNENKIIVNSIPYNFPSIGNKEHLKSALLFTTDDLDPSNRSSGRFYYFSVFNANTLQSNFVPCIDNLGNPCMYDTVTKETFRNEGSGQFIVPAETTTYSLRQPQAAYAQLTKHGICRLYHVPEGYEGSEEDYAQEFGFKQLVENERPEEIEEGYYWHPRWKETETEVILYWTKEIKEEMTDV